MFKTRDTSPLSIQLATLAQQVDEVVTQLRTSRTTGTLVDRMTQLSIILGLLKRQIVESEEELRSLRALAGIGEVINSSLDLDVVLRIVMDTVIRLVVAERGFLMLPDEHKELTMRVARNWEQETISPEDFAISHTIITQVAAERKPVLTTNAQQDPRYGNQDSIVTHNLRSILCVPMLAKSELIGIVYVDNRIRIGIFTRNELDMLTSFGNQAAVAIENARLFASVQDTLAEMTTVKNLMDSVFSSIPSGVITADLNGKVRKCNHAAEIMLGTSEDEITGVTLKHILPLGPALQPHVAEVVRTDIAVTGLVLSPSLPERGIVNLLINLSPLKDADNKTQGVAIVLEDVTEKNRLEAQSRLFERMLAPAVIQQLNLDDLHLGGQRTEITIIFADIRGFTSFNELQPPELVVSILNHHLEAAVEAILEEGGTIDKFVGDAVMAWFNAPILQPDHTLRAVRAALGIRKAIQNLHAGMPSDHRLSFGVGIQCGEVVLGLVGAEKRMDYTAIGDCITTAKRIQENTSPGQILISSQVYARVKEYVEAFPVDPIQAKGKRSPLEVYEVSKLKG